MLSFHSCIMPSEDLKDDTYLNNLGLRNSQRELLRDARRAVRDALRAAFIKETSTFYGDDKPISPSFFTQGSWGYKTINRPTHIPPQQTDMDDGCYLPMSFVRGANPKRAATWFFDVADRALSELTKAKGWKYCDMSKPTCCRVVIDESNHLDVPLYAIRDEQFLNMKKLAEAQQGVLKAALSAPSEEDEYTFDWSQVTDKDVLLAKRTGVWSPSNAMDVSRWADAAVEQKGPQLRRVWRAIKGWRDHVYPQGGGPSSICLMAMVEADFEEISRRDDLALKAAAGSVCERIMDRVAAPWDKREDLNRLGNIDRKAAARLAKLLEAEIEYCIQGSLTDATKLLERLGNCCGAHFSCDLSRVKEVSPRQIVHSYPVTPAIIPSFRGNNRSA